MKNRKKQKKIENSPIREDKMQVIFHKTTVPALICGGSTEDARKIFFFYENYTIQKKTGRQTEEVKGK